MPTAIPNTTVPTPMPACPRCRQATTVGRVPDLIDAGLSTTPAKGTAPLQWQGTTYYAPFQTADSPAARLALRLFPTKRMRDPPIPEVQMPKGRSIPQQTMVIWLACFLIFIAIGFLILGTGVVYLVIVGLLGMARAFAQMQRMAAWEQRRLGRAGSFHMVEDSRVTQAFKAVEPGTPHYKKAMAAAEAKQARAADRWQRACYCPADDCIFIPGEPAIAPPEQMESLLYNL